LATKINTGGGKSLATRSIFKQWVSAQKFHGQPDASVCNLSKCCFLPPGAEPRYQVFCSLPTHYATRVALHNGTVLCLPTASKYLTAWPDENLISSPNSTSRLEGGEGSEQQQHNNEKNFFNYIVMSPKYGLPTWRLCVNKHDTGPTCFKRSSQFVDYN
jgi:hypothetical protein